MAKRFCHIADNQLLFVSYSYQLDVVIVPWAPQEWILCQAWSWSYTVKLICLLNKISITQQRMNRLKKNVIDRMKWLRRYCIYLLCWAVDKRSEGTWCRTRGKCCRLDASFVSADFLLDRLIQPCLNTSGPLLVEMLERDYCKRISGGKVSLAFSIRHDFRKETISY